ncbi:MAG: 6-phosphogluconolactonase [Acidimicrobiales bacterium]
MPAAFAAVVTSAFAARTGPRFTMLLSGGPTARACYEALAARSAPGPVPGPAPGEDTAGGPIDWRLVDVYMGDERVVPPDDPDANQLLVRQALLDRVGPVGSFTPMPTEGPVEQCVADYQRVLAALLQGPGIDLIHLGLGPDGHTASLFAGAPTLEAGPGELVAATADPNGRNPHPRLTVTLPVIDAARCAVFTVAGEAKRDAIARVRDGDDVPGARVAAAEVIWLVDGAAFGTSP